MHILLQQFILLSILAVVLYLLPLKPKKRDLSFMIIAFIPMWYIHSMVKVGTVPDTSNYERMFYQVQSMGWMQCLQDSGAMEPGWVLLNKATHFVSDDYYFFQGLYGFVLLFLYFYAFRKYSPYVMLSIIILLCGSYNISIYVMRQYLAVAIFVASLPLILERRLYLFLTVCTISFFIHKTAIICVPVYFIFQLKPQLMILVSGFIAIIIFLGADLLEMFTIESLEDYQKYLESDGIKQNWISSALSAFEFIVFVLVMKDKIWQDEIIKMLFVLILLAFLTKIAIIGRDGTISRLPSYYGSASLFALPYILKEIKKDYLKIVVAAIILFLKIYPTFFGSSGLGDLTGMRLL